MWDELDGEHMNVLMRAFVAIEDDDPSEDEAFRRMAALFNRIYAMGQEHERSRSVAGEVAEVAIRTSELYNQNAQLLQENSRLQAWIADLEWSRHER